MTRDELLAWAKQRALEYCDEGEINSALASMLSDLHKHPELENHAGGKWFRKGPAKYPEEEIPAHEAVLRAGLAVGHGLEVRIADGGDMLVFHARDGAILHGRGFLKFCVAVADRELKEKERLTWRSENG